MQLHSTKVLLKKEKDMRGSSSTSLDSTSLDSRSLNSRSLNSTGLDLSEADRVRNFILMGESSHTQEKYYNNYWYTEY